MKERIIFWKRGRVLLTTTTRRWGKKEFDEANETESKMIFSEFLEMDQGCGRKLVCTLNNQHPDFEKNRILIEHAPQLLSALRDLHDEQNGPPLIRHEDNWNKAMEMAGKLLSILEKD